MANITLSIPDETKARMAAHPNVRWSRTMRSMIEQKLDDFERADALAKKGGLTMKDLEPIMHKVDEATRRHARMLLNESRR